MDIELLRARSRFTQAVRAFFLERRYLEVDTPLLAPALIPEPALEVFRTEWIDPRSLSARELFLIPSPELWMKRLLARGSGNLFQICKAFRNFEALGRYHNPEFTMLEWYTVGAGYLDSADLTDELLGCLAGIQPSVLTADDTSALERGICEPQSRDYQQRPYRQNY